jgi:AraC family transcriptional regulator
VSEEYSFPTNLQEEPIEHLHLLSSQTAGWNSLHLIYELEPAGEMPAVVSSAHSLVICLGDCQASFKLSDRWHSERYSSGDIIIFPAGEFFPRVRIDRPVPLIELFLPSDSLINAARETLPSKITLRSHLKLRDPLIQQMGLALKTELETAGVDSKLYADSMATALSVHLLQRYADRNLNIKEYKQGLPPHKLDRVIEYIQVNLEEDLSITKLADLVEISPHYFASLFKQSIGLTPHQYVVKCRLERAKILLRRSHLPIIEICHQVGWQNQSHFTRIFRQHFHITPKAYRDL